VWVVKLGGSLAHYPDDLKNWLGTLAGHGKGRVVLVPGGGVFADLVRHSQEKWGFDDAAAHAMGLRAMEQYSFMLCGLQTGLLPAGTEAEILTVLQQNQVPVWLPAVALANEDIEPSWDITSDSLAAWLARRLQAQHLVLVKSCALPKGVADLAELAKSGIVDAAFPSMINNVMFDIRLLNRKDYALFDAALMDEQAGGVRAPGRLGKSG
jgi:aspartokinase-like uncharacterized kinase